MKGTSERHRKRTSKEVTWDQDRPAEAARGNAKISRPAEGMCIRPAAPPAKRTRVLPPQIFSVATTTTTAKSIFDLGGYPRLTRVGIVNSKETRKIDRETRRARWCAFCFSLWCFGLNYATRL